MHESSRKPVQNSDPFKPVAEILFNYLHDIIYKPSEASLDIECLPEAFGDFGRGLQYFGSILSEMRTLAKELANGNLNCTLPSRTNEIASPLKTLHASLRHLTWQTQQVAMGDYKQRVSFMGDFSTAFNNMIEQLEQRQKITLDEKTKLEMYVHLILVNNPNPILLFDGRGKLAYVSDSFFRYCKIFRKNDVLGKQIQELFAPVVSEQSLIEIQRLYLGAILEEHMFETEQEIDFGNPDSSGYFSIQITPMYEADGSITGIIVFLFDMTESINARRTAEHARELAEQSSRSKSNFLAKMSHEIRTPMNAILGMAELALREEVSPPAEEHLRIIRQAGVNLLSIINDILDLTKIEVGKLEIIPMDYFFSSLVNDVINIIKTRVLESRLRFVANIDCNIPNELSGDAIRLRQILLNLLSNAVKYTERGFISFSVRGETITNDTVNLTIEVSDSGTGIKPEEVEKIFDEFTRFDLEKNRGVEGTGLGLAICQSFVTAMGGKIDVRSTYGKGSTFIVTLPQTIRSSQKMTVVENADEKNVLIYERREIYANSIIRTMDNLRVHYKLVSNASDFLCSLASNNYSFVLLASALYDESKKKHPNLTSKAKFAVIAELGEASTDRNISTLTMPVYCLPVANFLNGASDMYTGNSGRRTAARLTAPEAKVMVVDDINTNLIVAEGLLQPYKVQIKLCKSGIEAIKEIKSGHYDLVLLDNMMPDMDGVETLTYIRALGGDESYYKKVPIVALTADAVFGAKEKLLKHGFDDFMSKPIDMAKLDAILEKWIPKEKQRYPAEEDNQSTASEGQGMNQDTSKEIEIDGLNVKKGLAMTGGKRDSYLKLLSTFSKDGPEKIREIKTCFETENIALYMVHVHALKSAAAIIGAGKLSQSAAMLEDAGKRRDSSFIHIHNAPFLKDLEKLLHDIDKVLSEGAEEDENLTTDKDLLKNELYRLKTALDTFNSIEINKSVNILQEFIQTADVGAAVETISKNIMTGGYDEATILIDSLLQELNK